MRILVTGGAGFIGSAVCRAFVSELGLSVVNFDKLTYAADPRSVQSIADDPRYTFVRGDVCDRDEMDSVLRTSEPDAVLHLAAESHVDRSITGSEAFIETNIIGTYRLLEASRKYYDGLRGEKRQRFRFVHVSTDEVYGALGSEGQFTEVTPYRPSSPYSASKAGSDHLALSWWTTYGLPVIVSNCSNNYGPFQFPEKLIPLMILNALEGMALPVYGAGTNVRDWLHVSDHALGLYAALRYGVPGEKYNFGGSSERTNLAVVEHICDLVDRLAPGHGPRRSLITFVTDRPGHDFRYSIDASKATRELGWGAQQTFDKGLESTVRWYLDNDWWWKPLRQRVYGGERLGLVNIK